MNHAFGPYRLVIFQLYFQLRPLVCLYSGGRGVSIPLTMIAEGRG